MKTCKELDVWIQSMQLVREIYIITKVFPKEEQYILTSQTRKAAVSIPCNIAEGVGRNYKKDTIQFLHISRGSLYELETLLSIAVMNKMIDQAVFDKISSMISSCMKLLNGLTRYYENNSLK